MRREREGGRGRKREREGGGGRGRRKEEGPQVKRTATDKW
jgi:hypothetical protein